MKKFLLILASLLIFAGCQGSKNSVNYLPFAECLTAQEFTLYGAYWCPHCNDQKELFGEAFKAINYVECDPNGPNAKPEVCIEKDIKRYPTWIRGDGTRWESLLSMGDLAKYSTCELPEQESKTKEAVTAK